MQIKYATSLLGYRHLDAIIAMYSDGNLLNSTTVTIDEMSAIVTANPLMLTGVQEFIPIGE